MRTRQPALGNPWLGACTVEKVSMLLKLTLGLKVRNERKPSASIWLCSTHVLACNSSLSFALRCAAKAQTLAEAPVCVAGSARVDTTGAPLRNGQN